MEVVKGLRMWWIVLSLCLGLLFSSLESTIVATALVSIASDFDDYERGSWIIVVYLIVYSSFLVIYARLSDTTGRKPALLTGLIFFTSASLACGLARSLNELIVFRAFQGLGGAGIYALSMVIVAEITPSEQYGIVSGILGVVFALASAIGPVVGGAITSATTWRWCFYFNVPGGLVVIVMVVLSLPAIPRTSGANIKQSFSRIDWLGCILSLAASVTTVIPLEAGDTQFRWNSGQIIVLFVVAGLCWIAFAIWQTWLAHNNHAILPLTPISIAMHRVIGSCILTAMLTGIPFTGTIVYLPQRFQVSSGLSPVAAGIRMLPLVVVSALTFSVVGVLLSKKNMCFYFIIAGNALQLIGLGLMSSLKASDDAEMANYGYQVVAGIGFGTTLCSSGILARIEVRREDIAPLMGAITQLRLFGSVIGVALCRVVLFSYMQQHLSQTIPPDMLQLIMSNVALVSELPPDENVSVREAFGRGLSQQSRVLMYIAAGNLAISLFTFRRHARPVKSTEAPQAGHDHESGQEQDATNAVQTECTLKFHVTTSVSDPLETRDIRDKFSHSDV